MDGLATAMPSERFEYTRLIAIGPAPFQTVNRYSDPKAPCILILFAPARRLFDRCQRP